MGKGGCPRRELGWGSDAAWQVACLLCKQDGWEVSHTRETRAGINLSLNRALGARVLSLRGPAEGGELPPVETQEHPRTRSTQGWPGAREMWVQVAEGAFPAPRSPPVPTLFPQNR